MYSYSLLFIESPNQEVKFRRYSCTLGRMISTMFLPVAWNTWPQSRIVSNSVFLLLFNVYPPPSLLFVLEMMIISFSGHIIRRWHSWSISVTAAKGLMPLVLLWPSHHYCYWVNIQWCCCVFQSSTRKGIKQQVPEMTLWSSIILASIWTF